MAKQLFDHFCNEEGATICVSNYLSLPKALRRVLCTDKQLKQFSIIPLVPLLPKLKELTLNELEENDLKTNCEEFLLSMVTNNKDA